MIKTFWHRCFSEGSLLHQLPSQTMPRAVFGPESPWSKERVSCVYKSLWVRGAAHMTRTASLSTAPVAGLSQASRAFPKCPAVIYRKTFRDDLVTCLQDVWAAWPVWETSRLHARILEHVLCEKASSVSIRQMFSLRERLISPGYQALHLLTSLFSHVMYVMQMNGFPLLYWDHITQIHDRYDFVIANIFSIKSEYEYQEIGVPWCYFRSHDWRFPAPPPNVMKGWLVKSFLQCFRSPTWDTGRINGTIITWSDVATILKDKNIV